MAIPGVWAELGKEILALIKDFNDPNKRRANFKLNLDKDAYRKIEVAEDYIHTATQYIVKTQTIIQVIDKTHPDVIDHDQMQQLDRLKKYLEKYEKRFR